MPTWVQVSHHDARAIFVAKMVKMFGSVLTPLHPSTLLPSQTIALEAETAQWNEALTNSSNTVKNKLHMLGIFTLEDANVALYTCIVAVSRYKWGVRGPAASTKRFWVQAGRKLTATDILSLIEQLPEHADAVHQPMAQDIETVLPHVTCSLCKKPIAGLRPSKIIGRCPMRCSTTCKNKQNFEDRKLKRKLI